MFTVISIYVFMKNANFHLLICWKWCKHSYIGIGFYFFVLSMMKKVSIVILSWILFVSTFCIWGEYSSELQQAYNWAYENKITTMSSIERANMNWNITREEMAKMISNYAINILWRTPDTTKTCLFLDSNINPDLVESVTKSCQLWLMGQWVASFRPKDNVSRAEFWTVLSRALWWNKNEGWDTYYENHLKALKFEWIMNKIEAPMNKEIRWYVMLMLMRSVPESDYIQSYNDEDYTEYVEISYVMEMLD